ncbi:YopX family protein [Bacillus altitudinis]|uniref:YopX family protein n=1 Tax=Bacillus altitudinis TaxID=293387 RepID=UPI0005D3B67A|nr:YopX family protein [Bacillus altitudinis]KJF45842.1 hypothetical protein BAIE_18655 [Bacillus altitudinis]
MRDIKFQALVVKHALRNLGSNVHRAGIDSYEEIIDVHDISFDNGKIDCVSDKDGDEYSFADKSLKAVRQYTGLKDKNDKKIYEGDAIFWEIDNGVGIESYSAVVYYSENTEKYKGMYKWIVVYLGDFHRGEFDELRTPSRYKDSLQVFGNIYESPELLTEK